MFGFDKCDGLINGTWAPFTLANLAVVLLSVVTTISVINLDFLATSNVFLINGFPSKVIDLPFTGSRARIFKSS